MVDVLPPSLPAPPPPGPPDAYARWPRRLSAATFDGLITVAFALACFSPALFVFDQSMPDDGCRWLSIDATTTSSCRSGLFSPTGAVCSLAASSSAFVLGWALRTRRAGRTGATRGQQLVRIRTVDAVTGIPIGFARTAGRQLLAWSLSTHVLGLGILWCLWDDRRRTWHDVVLNTVVVRDDRGSRRLEPIPHERADDGGG